MENMSNTESVAIDIQADTESILSDFQMDMPPPPPVMQRAVSVLVDSGAQCNVTNILPILGIQRSFTDQIVDVPWTPPEPDCSIGYIKTPHSILSSMNLDKELPAYIPGMVIDSTVILDETGSMESMGNEPVQSVNSYIDGQRESGFSGLYIRVIRFNEYIYHSSAIPVTNYLAIMDYKPRGMTALFDAIAYAILTAEKAQHIVIVTDGMDNSSVIKLHALNTLIQKAESLGWSFTYIGCTPEAFNQGQKLKMSNAPVFTEECPIDPEFDLEGVPPPPPLLRAMSSASSKVASLNRAQSQNK